MTVKGIATSNFAELSKLKELSNVDSKKALPEVAKQFEAIFCNRC